MVKAFFNSSNPYNEREERQRRTRGHTYEYGKIHTIDSNGDLSLKFYNVLALHQDGSNELVNAIFVVSYSIMLNESSFGFLISQQGLRQGEPLLHFLFILGTEVLTMLIKKTEQISAIQDIKVARIYGTCYLSSDTCWFYFYFFFKVKS